MWIPGSGVLSTILAHILEKPLPLLRSLQTDSLFQGKYSYVGEDADIDLVFADTESICLSCQGIGERQEGGEDVGRCHPVGETLHT